MYLKFKFNQASYISSSSLLPGLAMRASILKRKLIKMKIVPQ